MVLLWSNVTYANEEPSELYAQSAVLMDGESGRVLFSKDGECAKANASTTKIMTCILALEIGDMESTGVASKRATQQPKVHLGVKEGEEFYLQDMLYALMLESFNDTAVVLAEAIAGTVEDFMKLVNEKAKEIGCEDTYFITPNGLDAEEGAMFHHTTAVDLARIMKYCIKESPKCEEFLKITQTPNYQFRDVSKKRSFNCNNHNTLLQTRNDALSGKTGFTNDAGYCYVGAIENDGRTFIIAILGCGWPNNRNYKWKDAAKLLEYGTKNYQYREVGDGVDPEATMKPVLVEGAKTLEETYYTKLQVGETDAVQLLMREDEKVSAIRQVPYTMCAPVTEGTLVGTVRYCIDDKVWKVQSVYTTENVKKEDWVWRIWKQFQNFSK